MLYSDIFLAKREKSVHELEGIAEFTHYGECHSVSEAAQYLRYKQLTDPLLQVRQCLGFIKNIILEPLENSFPLGVCNLQNRNPK